MTALASSRPAVTPTQSVTALALADARRFARHPLFLFAVAVIVLMEAAGIAQQSVVDVGVEGTVFPAFFLGVFGFVVGHRLTTSLRRSGDLADTAPVGAQRRTLALCLACLVPAAVGVLVVLSSVVFGAVWPPTMPDGQVAWFGYESASEVWGALIGDVVLASLGGPLLGVAVATWAPFRGSALLGMTVLVTGVIMQQALASPWYAIAPWVILSDEHVVGGEYQSSWIPDAVSPAWWCGYAACLCALAVVAALMRDRAHRRQLAVTGGAIVAAAVGFLLLAVA